MTQPISVDCIFQSDGTVRIRRLAIEEKWQTVEQGRQWLDEEGRHVLVLSASREVEHLVLTSDTLQWQMKERPQPKTLV